MKQDFLIGGIIVQAVVDHYEEQVGDYAMMIEPISEYYEVIDIYICDDKVDPMSNLWEFLCNEILEELER